MEISIENTHLMEVKFTMSMMTFDELIEVLNFHGISTNDFFRGAFAGHFRELNKLKHDQSQQKKFDEVGDEIQIIP